jgi:GntR family transcriptional regulator/MocR family aminotransferase
MLIDEIRTKILPRRGIQSTADEILITVGNQQALHLICMLFVDSTTTVALEEPGYPEIRELLQQQGAKLIHQNVDAKGVVVDERLNNCNIVYTTPSHQTPTSITMSLTRRDELLQKAHERDCLIIEDDFEFESNFLGQPHPALRSLDNDGRVVYVSCLSKVLVSGVQIGFIVADKDVITELRKLRKMILRNPPYNNQRAVAYFLSLGYYDAYMMQLHKTFFERWLALREALNIYLPNCIDTGPIEGGTAYWITGPEQLDGEYLREKAAEIGILIEPVKRYFSGANYPENCFRMGVTSIPTDRIQEGVKKLAELIYKLTENYEENLSNAKGRLLCHLELEQVLPDIKLECQMVYGVPCIIELRSDGVMFGHTGGKDPENDIGRWWIENGIYYRKWNLWSYGEVKGYYIIIDGNEMKWFDKNNRLARQLVIKDHKENLDL